MKRRRQRHDNDIINYHYRIYYFGGASMEHIINITQELTKTGNASYEVKMTVDKGDDVETIEFNYSDCNGIFPLYNSLINTIRGIEDCHVVLTTSDKRFAREVRGIPNKNARLLEILKQTQEIQSVTIDAN